MGTEKIKSRADLGLGNRAVWELSGIFSIFDKKQTLVKKKKIDTDVVRRFHQFRKTILFRAKEKESKKHVQGL